MARARMQHVRPFFTAYHTCADVRSHVRKCEITLTYSIARAPNINTHLPGEPIQFRPG
jgi:hypothetical protein